MYVALPFVLGRFCRIEIISFLNEVANGRNFIKILMVVLIWIHDCYYVIHLVTVILGQFDD